MMSLLKPSQALAKQPRLPSPSCSSWRLSRKRPRLWSWRRPVSLLSRYAVPEVMISLSVSQTKAAYLGLNQRYNFALPAYVTGVTFFLICLCNVKQEARFFFSPCVCKCIAFSPSIYRLSLKLKCSGV